MTPLRPAAGLLATMLAVAACTSGGGSDSAPSGDGGSSGPTSPGASTPSVGPSPSATPDLSRLQVSTGNWRTDFSKANVDFAEIVSGGPPKDGIPAIDSPVFESIELAGRWLDPRAPVIALELNGQARAYPLAILMWHEIVNDTVGDVPVVVTFCPLCNTALVFERELDGVVHDFGTTGNLRYSDLVMYDRQTETWWQQATGIGIVGELTDRKLTFVPAQIIAFEDFTASYPDGDVLSRETGFRRDYGRNPYVGYDTIDQDPFLFFEQPDPRLQPKERVVTVGEGDEAVAYPYSRLETTGVATGTLDGETYVVFWMPGTASALDAPNIAQGKDIGATGVFRPIVDGRELTFQRDGGRDTPIRDVETGSTWSITGQAIEGELAGSRLEPVVHGDHFWFAWAAFAPETTVWSAG